jgi:hypothetical protein
MRDEHETEALVEDLEVTEEEAAAVKGGVGDGLPTDEPLESDVSALKKLPGKRKPPTLTLK